MALSPITLNLSDGGFLKLGLALQIDGEAELPTHTDAELVDPAPSSLPHADDARP